MTKCRVPGCLAIVLSLVALTVSLPPPATARPVEPGGRNDWVEVSDGRLKVRIYSSSRMDSLPVLVVTLHGDVPNPRLNYTYVFSRLFAEGAAGFEALPEEYRSVLGEDFHGFLRDAFRPGSVVAAAILRPGYSDEDGDRSDGELGMALGDNYTPEVVDSVAAAIETLKADYGIDKVVLVGHSGGATIAADVLGRHPEVADGVLLIACGCDPLRWRARAREGQFADANWNHPYNSLSPMDLAGKVSTDSIVRMLVGSADTNSLPEFSEAYAGLLRDRGIDVRLTIAQDRSHDDIVFTSLVFDTLQALVREVRERD